MRGTLEWKPITVTKEVYSNYLFDYIVPGIMRNFPPTNNPIWIQQDNARPHIKPDEFREKYLEVRDILQEEYSPFPDIDWDIRLYYQPPNPPDLNVNDLGLYAAMQALTWKCITNMMDELVEQVNECWEQYPSYKINNMFLTLQCCMNEIIDAHGDNDYDTPHINKQRLEKEGQLLVSFPVTHTTDVWDDIPVNHEDNDGDNTGDDMSKG